MTKWLLEVLVYPEYVIYALFGVLIFGVIMALIEVNWWRVIAIRKHERFGVAAHRTHYTVAHTCFGMFWIDLYGSDFKPIKFDSEPQAYQFLSDLREIGRKHLETKAKCKLAKKKKTTIVEKYEMVTSVPPDRCEYLAKKGKENAAA